MLGYTSSLILWTGGSTMKVIEPWYQIERIDEAGTIIRLLEKAARNCYKSEKLSSMEEATEFLRKNIMLSGHHSVIEHINVTVRIVCDRGISHELVRHRIASFSQESTRYCNYSKGKHGSELTFIRPFYWEPQDGDSPKERAYKEVQRMRWIDSMRGSEKTYLKMMEDKVPPQEARAILPNSLKTEVIMTANFRSWRNFFQQRTAVAAHPQMRQIAQPMLDEFKGRIPMIFDDLTY